MALFTIHLFIDFVFNTFFRKSEITLEITRKGRNFTIHTKKKYTNERETYPMKNGRKLLH